MRRGPRRKSDHPFPVALDRIGSSAPKWGKQNGFGKSKVKSWYSTAPSAMRPIPRRAAELIEKQFGIPAVDASWPAGISDEEDDN